MNGGILIVAEHRRGELRDITREAVSAGAELKAAGVGPVALALIARDPATLVPAATLEGVDAIIQVPVAEDEFNADVYALAVEALIRHRKPAVVLSGYSSYGMGFGSTVAVRLGLGFASDVVGCSVQESAVVARRQYYGGKVEAELEFSPDASILLLLRPTAWDPAAEGGSPEVAQFDAAVDSSRVRTRHREFIDPPSEGLDISLSQFILSIGRGVGDRENLPRFEALAEKMGATLAASRPLIDAGWLPSSRQVGQSGVVVKPKVYLALGISGAAQHVAGMRASGKILAVNTDAHAAIFQVAHYGAVIDLYRVVNELEKLW
jgi:electron transfer flavoprotein alpha subunit